MANITLDKLKTIVQSIVASVTRYKPNLSVNDPDDPRYVAGRLCYKTDPVEKTLVENETIETEESYTESVWSFLLGEGQSYTVVWDGVTYTDVCTEYDGGYGVGNTYLYSDNAKDTGEPFYIETWDGVTSVYASETGVHTVTIVTIEPGKIIPLPQEYLPQIPADKLPEIDLDLANVAYSGSYNDLNNRPTIPANVVQYTAQSLTTAQKTQARTNIGAGTSSFDGAYSSLTGAPVLAPVATSGDYDDMQNRPFYKDVTTESIYVSSSNKPRASTLNDYGYYEGYTTGSSFASTVGEKYALECSNGETYVLTSRSARQSDTGYNYCKVLGNAAIAKACGLVYSMTDGLGFEDTGEPFVFISYSSTAKNQIASTTVNFMVTHFYSYKEEVKTIDSVFIPSTIQRVGEPLYLTDSAGAKWQLVVGTDGTLSTTAATE